MLRTFPFLCLLLLVAHSVQQHDSSTVFLSSRDHEEQCKNVRCEQQGSECRVTNGEALCECIQKCPDLSVGMNEFVCGSDGSTHISSCFMDMHACQVGGRISVVQCEPATAACRKKPNVPGFLPVQRNHLAVMGERVNMTCLVSGEPPPTVGWLKRSAEDALTSVGGDNDERVWRDGQSLVIERAGMKDAGDYVCIAANCRGDRIEKTFTLRVRQEAKKAYNFVTCRQKIAIQTDLCRTPHHMREFLTNKWTFDIERNLCVPWNGRGCNTIQNLYETREECEDVCVSICNLPPIRGPCVNFQMRIYFNVLRNSCETMIYSGCGGNDNRYRDMEICRRTCIDVERAVKIAPVVTCPFCTKSPALAYCNEDFVIAAHVLLRHRASTVIEVRVTRVFKDHHLVNYKYLDLHSARDARRTIHLALNHSCPCPDLKYGLRYRHNNNASERSSRKVAHRWSQEVIVSGKMVHGLATITQGSLLIDATAVHVARMSSHRRFPMLCHFIRNWDDIISGEDTQPTGMLPTAPVTT